ncbi:MAG: alpha/beta hydrolase [Paracoccaceae bacterium]
MPEDLIAGHLAPWRSWDRGAPRPVLALHCSLAHSGAWSGLAERLSGVTVTALDQPGHGRAAEWDRVEDLHALTTRIATHLAEMLSEAAGDGPIDLFGHSFGGTVCLRLALDRPDLVRSLMLVEPVIFAAARGTPAFDAFRAGHEGVARAVADDPARGAALFHATWGTGEPLADLPERSRRYIIDRIHHIPAQNPVLVEDAAGLLRPGGLEAMDVPVLLVEGADSPPVIDAVQGVLAARLPRAQRLIVPGAGHMVPITHPDLVARAVQAHLDAA